MDILAKKFLRKLAKIRKFQPERELATVPNKGEHLFVKRATKILFKEKLSGK